jgi:hypothetical protein
MGKMLTITEQVINKLFVELASIYPAWKQAFPNQQALDESKRQYMKAFKEEGLDSWDFVERGLKEARRDTSPFLPSVGQFVDWCRWNEQRDNPVWFLKDVGDEQVREIISARKKLGLPCGKYDNLAIEDKTNVKN